MILRLATLAYPVTAPATMADYAEKFAALVAEGAAGGAQMLVMPEYACMEAAAAFPGQFPAPAMWRGNWPPYVPCAPSFWICLPPKPAATACGWCPARCHGRRMAECETAPP